MPTYKLSEEVYEYKIPTHYVCPIVNADFSALEDNELVELDEFMESMPSKGHGVWSWGEDEYFARDNDINNLGSDVIDATFVPYIEVD